MQPVLQPIKQTSVLVLKISAPDRKRTSRLSSCNLANEGCGSNRSKALMLNDRLSNKGGKNENVTSSLVLVRTRFCPVRMAGMVLWAADGNGKASACKY